MWWLVAETNSEEDHDAELLPFFALIGVDSALAATAGALGRISQCVVNHHSV